MDPRDLKKWLSEKKSLNVIANLVSKRLQRKLMAGEIVSLKKYIENAAKNYADQVESKDNMIDVQGDIATRFYRALTKHSKPPSSTINVHEMLKSQIKEENVEVHEASGYAELKYQDDICYDDDGNPIDRFGGASGRDFGLYGEQPTIVRTERGYETLSSVITNNAIARSSGRGIAYDNPALIGTSTNSTDTHDTHNSIVVSEPGLGAFINQFSNEERTRDEKMERLMIEANLMAEDMKIMLDKLVRIMEYNHKKDVELHNLPNDTDPKKVYFRDAYLQFDTRYRDLTHTFDENPGQYRWAVSNIPFLQQDGAAGVVFGLEDIVEMEVEAFEIPADNTFPNYYNRITLFIEEINTQAVMASEDTRYHWDFSTSVSGNKILLTPLRRKMVFIDPYRSLVQSTFVLRAPYQPIPFSKDRMVAVSQSTNPVIWTTAEPHVINTNDPVYFTDVDTGDIVVNTAINDKDGWPIIKLNSTQFTVAVDFTSVLAPVTTVVYFGAKRVIIPIRFRCLSRGKETNFMQAVGEHIL
jgi:hypothetical protein